jgi:hypothetical protein
VVIPDSVTSIGNYAFGYCNSLNDVYFNGTDEEWKKITIDSGNDSLLNANIHYLGEPEHVHEEVTVKGYVATCTTDGLTDGVKCDTCGEIIVAQQVIPAKDHNYVNGKCDVCGDVKASEGLEFRLNSDKENSIEVCKKLFPQVNLLATPRCKKEHDGIAEALLMAEYTRRNL